MKKYFSIFIIGFILSIYSPVISFAGNGISMPKSWSSDTSEGLQKIANISEKYVTGDPKTTIKNILVGSDVVVSAGNQNTVATGMGIIGLFKWVIGLIAMASLILAGASMIFASDEADAKKERKQITYSITGLLFVIAADPIVKGIFGDYETTTSTGDVAKITSGIADYIAMFSSIAGALAVFYIFYGGFMYMSAGGDDAKVKKGQGMIINAVVGLILIISAYALVTTFVT